MRESRRWNRTEAVPARSGGLPRSPLALSLAVVLAAALVIAAAPATVEAAPRQMGRAEIDDGRWLPWLGCWELVADAVDYEDNLATGDRLICVTPRLDGGGVGIATLVGGAVVLEESLVADGRQREIDESGCAGSQSAAWSRDGQRLFVRSLMTCEGGFERTYSGITLMTPGPIWTDIQVVGAGDRRELVVRKYRLASSEAMLDAGVAPLSQNRALAASTGRVALSAHADAEDIVEALDNVDVEGVEAMLLEAGGDFFLDAETLLYLDDADVPASMIDLMVALSFPDDFMIDRGGVSEVEEQPRARHVVWQPFPIGWYGPYWYGHSAYLYSPFGFGYPYWDRHYGYGPVYQGGPRYGGRVIKGKGYTAVRVRDNSSNGSFLSRLLRGGKNSSGGGSGNTGGTVTKGGATKGGSSTGTRTAKPRGGSSGGKGSPKRSAKPRGGRS